MGKTTFGGGFGTSTSTGFGVTPSTASTPFGASSSVSPGFGTSTTPAFGGTSAFGAPSQQPMGFGSTTLGGFGSTTSGGFGSAQGTSTFGQPSSGGLGFGQSAATPSAFGTTSGFGLSSAPTFGGASTTAFGTPSTTTFGAPSATGFGQTSTSGFGSSPASSFGQPAASGFGSTSTGGFGQPAATTTGFGSTAFGNTGAGAFGQTPNATSTFGQPSGATSGFGASGTGGGFGSSVSGFGTTPSTFGGIGTTPSGFGQTSTSGFGTQQPAFGQTAATPAFGSSGATTGAFGAKPGGFGTLSGTSGFGLSGTSPFGSVGTSSQPVFGQQTTSGFGQSGSGFGQATTGFGQQPAAGFGQQPAANFGQLATGFGQSTAGFGQPATSFGQSSGGFGQSTGGFGQSTGGFGQPAGGFGQSVGGFGQPATGFGQQPSSGFGATSGFGQLTTPQFGNIGGLGTMGSAYGAQPSSYGAATGQQQVSSSSAMQTHVVAGDDNLYSSLGRKLELLRKKKDALEINIKHSRPEVPQNPEKSNGDSSITSPDASSSSLALYTPLSTMTSRMTPRGFLSQAKTPSKDTGNPTTSLPSAGQDSRVGKTDFLLNRSAMQLILDSSRVVQDATANLPMPGSRPTVTPLRPSESSQQQSRADEESLLGEKTWLTPGNSTTPAAPRTLNPSALLFSAVNDHPASAKAPAESESTQTTELPLQPVPTPNQPAADSDHPPKNANNDVTADHQRHSIQMTEASINPLAPTLLRQGYGLSPSLSILQRMTDAELRSVTSFTIFRPNVGEIRWEGQTDVRGLDLDKLVRIEQNEVMVYENVEDSEKPTVGEGLNKRATITLWNIFPKTSSSQQKLLLFEAKLRKICDDTDADFHCYDSERGEWIFSVDHFSRYGLNDGDESDEEAPAAAAAAADKVIRPKSMFKKGKGAPVVANDTFPEKKAPTALVTEQSFSLQRSHHDGNFGRSDITSVLSYAGSRNGRATFLPSHRRLPAFLPVGESPTLRLLMQLKNEVLAMKGLPPAPFLSLNAAASHGNQASHGKHRMNIPLAMWRSFRVGWAPNGSIVHSGRPVYGGDLNVGANHTISIERVDPLSWAKSILFPKLSNNLGRLVDEEKRLSCSAMPAVLKASTSYQHSSFSEMPLWTLPSAVSDNVDEYLRFASFLKGIKASYPYAVASEDDSHHPDWTSFQTMDLLDSACGQETISIVDGLPESLLPLMESRCGVPPHLWERRREALSQWVQRLALHTGELQYFFTVSPFCL